MDRDTVQSFAIFIVLLVVIWAVFALPYFSKEKSKHGENIPVERKKQ